MIRFRPVVWTAAGALMLTACGGEAGGEAGKGAGEGGETGAATSTAPVPAGEGGEGGAEGGAAGGEAGAAQAYGAVPDDSQAALRLAHLEGFFRAAQAALPAQGADAASALAGQGMLEVFDPAAADFRKAGVDEAVLRKAGETGSAADLQAAVAALVAARGRAGGSPVEVAKGLAAIATGLYHEASADGVDPIEYQHAYGAALALKAVADGAPALKGARGDVARFIGLWKGPVAPADARALTPFGEVQAQASRIELALAGL